MSRIAIHYHTDPAARIASGVDSFIRGILQFAPDDLQYTLIGATTDAVTRPVGRFSDVQLGDRAVSFLPIIAIDGEGRRGRVPLTVRYLAALWRQRTAGLLDDFDILDFHRIEPLLFFGNDPRPKNLTLHQDMVVIRDPRSDILWRHAPGLYERIEARMLRRADRVFCVRRPAVERYRSNFPDIAGRFHFTPTWFDSRRFSPGSADQRAEARRALREARGWPQDARVLIFVGRLDRQKDPLLLIEAVAPLLHRDASLRVFMIGDGGLRAQVEQALGQAGVADRVHLAGATHGDAIAQLLRGADLFVMSSAYEGMPIAVLEGIASGLPVVSTPVGEVPTVIQPGRNGALAAEISAPALRAALQEVLDAPQLPAPADCARSVEAYRPEVVLAQLYDNHRRQSRA